VTCRARARTSSIIRQRGARLLGESCAIRCRLAAGSQQRPGGLSQRNRYHEPNRWLPRAAQRAVEERGKNRSLTSRLSNTSRGSVTRVSAKGH